MTWTLPNILTVFRLLAAPCVALVFLVLPRPLADWVALILFVAASMTDYFDGWLARKLNQISPFGTMLDPIADKAMVVIAIAVLMGLSGLNPLLVIPAVAILLREVFVSGLREFLGAAAGTLKVTKLAKWKTTVQMLAIVALFLIGIFELEYARLYTTNDPYVMEQMESGAIEDTLGVQGVVLRMQAAALAGTILIWLAAILTVVTGWDYFRKALPFLKG